MDERPDRLAVVRLHRRDELPSRLLRAARAAVVPAKQEERAAPDAEHARAPDGEYLPSAQAGHDTALVAPACLPAAGLAWLLVALL